MCIEIQAVYLNFKMMSKWWHVIKSDMHVWWKDMLVKISLNVIKIMMNSRSRSGKNKPSIIDSRKKKYI